MRSELRGAFLPGRETVEGGLVDLLLRSEAADPDRVHFRWPGGEMTVGEFADRARRWATLLAGHGVRRGDRVALICTNGPDFVALQFGTYMCGAVEVPVNAELRGEMLRMILADAEPAAVVIDEEIAAAAIEHIPRGVPAFVLDDGLRAAAAGQEPMADPVRPGAGELALILYTSGTTGPSKGVMLPHGYLPNTAATWIAGVHITGADVTYFPAPFFHVDGHVMNVICLMTGATFGYTKRFSVSRFWTEAHGMGATLFLAVGSMAAALVARRTPEPPAHSFRIGLVAPIPAEVFAYLEGELGIPLLQLYGQTEADGVTYNTLERNRRGSAGWACCGFDVRIADEDDVPIPVGEVGRVLYRPHEPHHMTIGYWNRPDATAACSRNMWWHTGDLGRVDEDGFLWFEGRASDSLRRRGENISAWELETALRAAPGVRSAAVIAVADEIGGEDEIKAFVSLEDGTAWDADRFFAYCAESLPRFAQPRFVEVMAEEDFVRGPGTGAIQKHLLPRSASENTIDRLEVAQ